MNVPQAIVILNAMIIFFIDQNQGPHNHHDDHQNPHENYHQNPHETSS